MKEIDKYMTPSEAAFYWRIPREKIKNKYRPSLMSEKQINDLGNLSEQDHRHVKRRFVKSEGFQNLCHASRTIKEIEIIHALYERKRSLQQSNFVFSIYKPCDRTILPIQSRDITPSYHAPT